MWQTKDPAMKHACARVTCGDVGIRQKVAGGSFRAWSLGYRGGRALTVSRDGAAQLVGAG